MKIKRVFVCFLILSIAIACVFAQGVQEITTVRNETAYLFVYCGAGLKKPMTEIAMELENQGIILEFSYAGSAQLLSQLQASKRGDLYIVGSVPMIDKPIEQGFLDPDFKLVAHHTPVIAVQKSNPNGISTLDDLKREDVRVILGNPKSNAIGKTAEIILNRCGIQEAVETRVVSFANTVNEIVMQLSAGNADAAIVTADSVFGNDKLEIVAIPRDKNIDQIIPVAIVTFTENREAAEKAQAFIAGPKGKAIFQKFGFAPVD